MIREKKRVFNQICTEKSPKRLKNCWPKLCSGLQECLGAWKRSRKWEMIQPCVFLCKSERSLYSLLDLLSLLTVFTWTCCVNQRLCVSPEGDSCNQRRWGLHLFPIEAKRLPVSSSPLQGVRFHIGDANYRLHATEHGLVPPRCRRRHADDVGLLIRASWSRLFVFKTDLSGRPSKQLIFHVGQICRRFSVTLVSFIHPWLLKSGWAPHDLLLSFSAAEIFPLVSFN